MVSLVGIFRRNDLSVLRCNRVDADLKNFIWDLAKEG
jgi:hypothetical protein